MKRILPAYFLWLVISNSSAPAEDFKRFEFQPFGGSTASGDIRLKGEDDASHGSIQVDSSYNVGATFAVNLNALDSIEGHWQRDFTEGRLRAEIADPQSSGSLLPFDLKIDQIHCNFLHHYEITDPRALPFVMAGLGATVYHAGGGREQSDSKSYFSFALGGGIKYFLSSHLGFRGEARWSPTLLSASESSFWCSIGGGGANCEVELRASLQHQVNLTGGVIFRF